MDINSPIAPLLLFLIIIFIGYLVFKFIDFMFKFFKYLHQRKREKLDEKLKEKYKDKWVTRGLRFAPSLGGGDYPYESPCYLINFIEVNENLTISVIGWKYRKHPQKDKFIDSEKYEGVFCSEEDLRNVLGKIESNETYIYNDWLAEYYIKESKRKKRKKIKRKPKVIEIEITKEIIPTNRLLSIEA